VDVTLNGEYFEAGTPKARERLLFSGTRIA
jgi:hypothetical protein